jgi:hypothetical protein
MPFPSFAGAEDSEVIEGQYYYAQTGLRKLLNRAHKYLYKSKSKGIEAPRLGPLEMTSRPVKPR